MSGIKGLLALTVAAAGLTAGAAAVTGDAPASGDFRLVVESATARVFPAVVFIRVVRAATEQGEAGLQQVSGSGVIVSPDGEVLTNWHVVEKAQSIRCLLSDGRAMEATLHGSDQDTDVAMIRLVIPEGGGDLPYARFDDSESLREGDFVMAMGAPFGLNRSVSIGIVSCTRRFLPDISEYSLWLQTDAAINPGNSGGPLVSTTGRIIGLNARGMGFADGMGFAIPSSTIEVLLPQLRDEGRIMWSWTGLQLQPLRDFNRDIYFDETDGVVVADTDPESPARRAGLLPRDRIVRVNDMAVTATTEEDLPAIRRALALLPIGTPATLEVARGGEMHRIAVTPREKGDVQGEEIVCERWDLTVKAINRFDTPDLHFHRSEGVFIYGLKWPGNAAAAGLREKDVIVRIGARETTTVEDVQAVYDEVMADLQASTRVLVTVLRNGLRRQVVLDFSRDYERD